MDLLFGFTLFCPKISSVSAKQNGCIGDLYVEPEFRKQGIGNILLKQAINFATEQDAVFVSLNTATVNFTAQSVYDQFGFEKCEPIPGYLYYHYKLKR